jgi:splicing factor U2AF subunit
VNWFLQLHLIEVLLLFRGISLKIKRPSDYNPSLFQTSGGAVPTLDTSKLGLLGGVFGGGVSNKVFLGGLPYELLEEDVKELVQPFGAVKSLHLVRDKDSNLSKGYGFIEWADDDVTDYACACLNDLALGDRKLTVRRADNRGPQIHYDLIKKAAEARGITLQEPESENIRPADDDFVDESNVICLLQMVTREDLLNDKEYEEIIEDIKDECNSYGKVLSVAIPKPENEYADPVPGEGKVFVEFAGVEDAQAAKNALQGRKFADRIVVAQFFNPQRYLNKDFV